MEKAGTILKTGTGFFVFSEMYAVSRFLKKTIQKKDPIMDLYSVLVPFAGMWKLGSRILFMSACSFLLDNTMLQTCY